MNKFGAKLQGLFKTELFERIAKKVEERKNDGYVKKLRAEKRKVNLKHSHKYFPAQKAIAENLFIVEGLCIHEDEKINIWRNGELLNIKIRDVILGDEVITHNNRFRKIINKQKKLKSCVTITLNNGIKLIQPPSHRYYVFDKDSKSFYFSKVSDLDLDIHCLVKSNLGNFIGNSEVIDKFETNNNDYPNGFILDDGSVYQCSNDHKYCTYDSLNQNFRMIRGSEIKIGSLVCIFDNI
jgi:hypothetical protein